MIKTCEICGAKYGTNCKNSKYCPVHVKVVKQCAICGKMFKSYRSFERKTCSHDCGYAYENKKKNPIMYNTVTMLPVIIAGDLYRGKTIEWIANRNNWAISDLESYISDNAQKIQKQLKLCKLNDYPKATGHEHHAAYIKHIHEPALI